MVNPFNGAQMRHMILEHAFNATEMAAQKSLDATEVAAYTYGNLSDAVVKTGKALLTAQTGNRIGEGTFKATKDLARGDTFCGTLCAVVIGCETGCLLATWLLMPFKMTTISFLKGISYGSTKFRDLCA